VKPVPAVARDFDAIARVLEKAPRREVLSPAERALVAHVPPNARLGLDVGCGDGVITRALARSGIRMIAIDVSPGMIALARARTDPALDIEFRLGDVMAADIPRQRFDLVVSVNTVHHLPLMEIIPRLADAVAPGGTLLVQDVVTRRGILGAPRNVAAVIQRRLRRLLEPSHFTRELAAAYDAHGADEMYLTPAEAERSYARLLPGARIMHHLEWRYSAIWTRDRSM
jgi:SAM-dependent methyltransferase